MSRKALTRTEFIERAQHIHGKKFDYSNTIYESFNKKVKIHCNTCNNDFLQTPHAHLTGNGCPYCRGHIHTTKEFIDKAIQIHKDSYSYDKTEFIKTSLPVKIFCNICHSYFLQKPLLHLHGCGCPKCRYKKAHLSTKLTQEEFIEKAKAKHGTAYDYSLVKYIDYKHPVKIKCNRCNNIFDVLPGNHLKGMTCLKCSIENSKLTKEEFINRANILHNSGYTYDLSNFKGTKSLIKITCKKCGKSFIQSVRVHLSNHGCPYCKQSRGEAKVARILEKLGIKYIRQYKFDDCRDVHALPFDFYLPDLNICIEYQGKQHYFRWVYDKDDSALQYRQKHDNIKRKYCKEKRIKLLEIKYNENIEEKIQKMLVENNGT